MKKKFLILPLLALSVGALSGCTKDDLAAFQSQANDDIEALKAEDSNLQSQIDEIKGDVASLKSQIASLKTELEGKIDEAKADYNAKVQAAQGKIDENKAAIQTLSTNFQTKEAELKAELEAEIAEVDAKYEGYITGENGINDQIAALQAALDAAVEAIQEDLDALQEYDESFYAEYVNDYNSFVNAINSLYSMIQTLNTNLGTLSSKHDTDLTELTNALNAAQEEISQAIASVRSDLNDLDDAIGDEFEEVYNAINNLDLSITDVENDLSALADRVNSLEAQIVQEKAAIQSDYNEKIDDLRNEMNAEAQALQNNIDELEDYIEMYADDLQNQIDDLVDYFGDLIDGLTHRVAVLEDVPEYTVTFDLNYDLWDGTVPEKHTVQVLKGDKVDEYMPVRPGMTLTEWTYEDTGKPWSFFGYVVTEDMELHAQWESEEGVTHSYDYANPKVFEKETLETAGHVRYRCTAHSGGSCYIDVREKAGKLLAGSRGSASSFFSFRSVVEQGRFYTGQTVTLQKKNGILQNYVISRINVNGYNVPVALAGDEATFYFTKSQFSETGITSILNTGALMTKVDEAILSNIFTVDMYLYDSVEADATNHIVPITGQLCNGDGMYMLEDLSKRGIVIDDIETDDDSGVMYAGESATATITVASNSYATHLEVGDYVTFYSNTNSSNIIGYARITSHNLIIPVSNNFADNPKIEFLESEDYDAGEYMIHIPEYAQNLFGDSYAPKYKNFWGFSRNSNPYYSPDIWCDEYRWFTTSHTYYADYSYESDLIFDDSFITEYVEGTGLKVTGYFANAGVWNLAVGDEVAFCTSWDYEGNSDFKSVKAQITKIEVDTDEFVDEFTGVNPSGTNEVSIYFNALSATYLSDVVALYINKTSITIQPNSGRGGVDGDGREFMTKFTIKGKKLPTAEDYPFASHKLLGFANAASATTPTFAPGEVYDGTSGLYAIWGEEIFSTQILAKLAMTQNRTALTIEVKGASIRPGQFICVETTDGIIKKHITALRNSNSNGLLDKSSAEVGQTVNLELAGIASTKFVVGGHIWILDDQGEAPYFAAQVLAEQVWSSRGTLFRVVLNQDIPSSYIGNQRICYLNKSGTTADTVLTGIASDNNGQLGNDWLDGANAGDTVWIMLRGVEANTLKIYSAIWLYGY